MIMMISLFLLLFLWGLADYAVWKKGGETLSQWVVKNSKENKVFGWGVIILLFGAALVLTWHFELFDILITPLLK
jgi:hypothetical protein